MESVYGLHHLMATVPDLTRTLRFYVEVLGMRLLSKTVELDETSVAQVYCGEAPGSIMSFQHRPQISKGTRGAGQVSNVAFSIAMGAYDFWEKRLSQHGIKLEGTAWSFGEKHLCFHDPDGMSLSLVADDAVPLDLYQSSPSVGKFWSIELNVADLNPTSKLLSYIFAYEKAGREGPVTRFKGHGKSAAPIDILTDPTARSGTAGSGIAHHLAWRVPDFETLVHVRDQILAQGYEIGPPINRKFFHACHFLAPEGMQFAIATDGPGFPSRP